ncbi:MAG: signal recognition particle-docking protein FtsY [bacterium]|nr:signal recognition particle-docking protein FtsY [bacterium]
MKHNLNNALFKTRSRILSGLKKIKSVLGPHLKHEILEKLEEILITADIGVRTTHKIINNLENSIHNTDKNDFQAILCALERELLKVFERNNQREILPQHQLTGCKMPLKVILAIGVNGVGKTTSIVKIAHRHKKQGKEVLLVATDTFRAAANEQIEILANRVNLELIKSQYGADPASVLYDGIISAEKTEKDIVLVDTAGRLHTKTNLMEEMKKMNRVICKNIQPSNVEVLLMIDSTAGHNAVYQTRIFLENLGVTGIMLTKLDGTAKGGIVIAIEDELEIPVKLVGTGEGIDDIEDFVPADFVKAILYE